MFGLMKRAPRLPYCGTCKTLGALYGQRSRILLNHDTVFLAELLFAHAGDPEWGAAYRSFNCLTLPREVGNMPIAVQYAASVTVALAHFHVEDHFADTRKFRWNLAARWLSPAYLRAAARLRAWQFPMDELEAILASQQGREVSPQSLEHVAEPTMTATALVFSHGFRLTGQPELAESMYRAGAKFGYLVYVLDAYEDRERDLKTGAFNPLVTFPGIDAREEILAALVELEPQVPPALSERLRVNVEERLGLRPRVFHEKSCRKPARDRWREAKQFARTLRAQERGGAIKGAAVLASVTALAFLFPHQARRTESWRECLGVSMNLMALGAIFATPPSPPPPPPHRPLSVHQAVPPKPSSGGTGFNCKDCCCEACGEGCCDACGEGCCSGCG